MLIHESFSPIGPGECTTQQDSSGLQTAVIGYNAHTGSGVSCHKIHSGPLWTLHLPNNSLSSHQTLQADGTAGLTAKHLGHLLVVGDEAAELGVAVFPR